MAISWAEIQFNSLEEFQAHLQKYDPNVVPWVKGLTVHHTAVPTVEQWRGKKSMDGMKEFYANKGWSGAPHLYIAPDGIWQANPLNETGIHAGVCNSDHWGMEVVGNYDLHFWEEPIRSLAYGAILALFRWKGWTSTDNRRLLGHKECLPNKSCPGNAVNLDVLRKDVQNKLIILENPFNPPLLSTAAQYSGSSSFIGAIEADSSVVRAKLKNLHPIKPYFNEKPYQDGDIDYIIDAYIAVAKSVNLNWVLLLAQCIHETDWIRSWWAARPRRNPAGIGVTGAKPVAQVPANPIGWYFDPQVGLWKAGYAYLDWKDSIEAHIGHVLNYIYTDAEMTPEQLALSNKSPRKKYLPASYRGAAKELNGLNGRWAVPGPTYGSRIASVANSLV